MLKALVLAALLGASGDSITGRTPLHEAASGGEIETVRRLLEEGATLEADSLGMTPLHLAAAEGRRAVIDLLRAAIPDPERELSAQEFRAYLLRHDPTCPPSIHGWTALHRAAVFGHSECASLLVCPRERNPTTLTGRTPLHYAALAGSRSMMRTLTLGAKLGRDIVGADLRIRDRSGRTALDYLHAHPTSYLSREGEIFPVPPAGELLVGTDEVDEIQMDGPNLVLQLVLRAARGARLHGRGIIAAVWDDDIAVFLPQHDPDSGLQLCRLPPGSAEFLGLVLQESGLLDIPDRRKTLMHGGSWTLTANHAGRTVTHSTSYIRPSSWSGSVDRSFVRMWQSVLADLDLMLYRPGLPFSEFLSGETFRGIPREEFWSIF